MKKFAFLLATLTMFSFFLTGCNGDNLTKNPDVPAVSSLTLFNDVLFYDGYAETVSEPVPEGTIRVSNSRYVKKIPSDFVIHLKSKLAMEVIVEAACDNYDRIGSVFISLIKKNEPYDTSNIISQIEVSRFITPFMDKNKSPKEVNYKFEIDNIARLLKDSDYYSKYDFWMELDIFGVPYAANKQICGCEGKNYTFFGTVNLTTGDNTEEFKKQYLVPIASFAHLNNYKDTDIKGKTIKSFSLELTSPIKNAKIYLITSNHGSNANGEEYNRRDHHIYFDNKLISVYKPGGISCEPFRIYNTQGNGIYGRTPMTDSEWSSFSNWCPGDAIPIRVFALGDLEAGKHTFKIEVPDAKFVDAQGDIPLSAYVQGENDQK